MRRLEALEGFQVIEISLAIFSLGTKCRLPRETNGLVEGGCMSTRQESILLPLGITRLDSYSHTVNAICS